MILVMTHSSALRFKSGKGKSIRIDRLHTKERNLAKSKINHFRNIFLYVFLFLGSVGLIGGVIVYKKLDENFVSAKSYGTYSSDLSSFSYIVVDSFNANPVQLKKLSYVILDKNSNKTLIFNIPLDINFNLPGKYADMPLNKTFALGEINSENKLKGGVELLNMTLFKMFGFSVDDYVLVEESLEPSTDKLLYSGESVFPFGGIDLAKMKESFDTSFSLKKFFKIQKFLSSVTEDNFVKIDLTPEKVLDTSFIDGYFTDMSLSSQVSSEKKAISVLNGTDLKGVAFLGSRVLKNMGGRVVSIENAMDKYPNTVLIADDPNSATVAYIKKAFNIDKVYTKENSPFLKESSVDRSDVTLILGFDIASKMY